MVKINDWEYYHNIMNELVSNEIFILVTSFGDENKYLDDIKKIWFNSKDLKDLKEFLSQLFESPKITNDNDSNDDELFCLIRFGSLLEAIEEIKNSYINFKKRLLSKQKNSLNQNDAITYIFKNYLKNISDNFFKESKEISLSRKNHRPFSKIIKSISAIINNKYDDHIIIEDYYFINDDIADLLELIAANYDSNGMIKFESEEEVILYNFLIYYSSWYQSTLLIREKMIFQDEKSKELSKKTLTPILDEYEERLSEYKLMYDGYDDFLYKILKN